MGRCEGAARWRVGALDHRQPPAQLPTQVIHELAAISPSPLALHALQ